MPSGACKADTAVEARAAPGGLARTWPRNAVAAPPPPRPPPALRAPVLFPVSQRKFLALSIRFPVFFLREFRPQSIVGVGEFGGL